MKRIVTAACATVIAAYGLGVHAQTTSTTTQTTKQATSAGGPVTITGCVAQISDESNAFALTQAKVSPSMPTGTTGATTSGAGIEAVVRYRLMAEPSVTLSSHAGKRVEVSGTIVPAPGAPETVVKKETQRTETPSGTVKTETLTIMSTELKTAPHLRVSSIKEVAGSCAPAATAPSMPASRPPSSATPPMTPPSTTPPPATPPPAGVPPAL